MLDLAQRIDIGHGASMAAAKLESDPEAIAYLAESLSLYITGDQRRALAQSISNLADTMAANRLH